MKEREKAVCGMLRLRNRIKRQSGLIIFEFILEWHGRRCEKNDRENNHLIHRWQKYDDRGEYDLSEYTGEEMDGGGHMEDHIATFDFMPEEDVIGHALSVKVEWKTGDEENAETMKLNKIPWYK